MNNKDAYNKGLRKPFYKGKFGEKHAASKISDKDRRRLYKLYIKGKYTRKELSSLFGIGTCQVGNIIRSFNKVNKLI